jgi:hypothetical protein
MDGELIFGGCGSDLRAVEAGFMPWFYAHVGDEVLFFGEVPEGTAGVIINGKEVEVHSREDSRIGLAVVALPYAQGEVQHIEMEAVGADGVRTLLAPTQVDPTSNTGLVIAFER